MAFTVEDGTGLTDSNAYVSVEFVDGYHSDRGNTKWTGSTGLKQSAIIRATEYIDKRFGRKFRGFRDHREQALEWPRLDAYSDAGYDYTGIDAVPRALQKATAEYALRALLLGELAPDAPSMVPPQNNASGSETETDVVTGEITRKKEVVGPIEEETEYRTTGQTLASLGQTREMVSGLVNTFSIPEYPAADLLMQELINPSTSKRIARG